MVFGAAGKTGSFFFRRKEKAFFLCGGKREVFRPAEQGVFYLDADAPQAPEPELDGAGKPPLVPERCALRRRILLPVSRPFRKIRGRPGIAAGLLRVLHPRADAGIAKKS
ncbi:MAG: hypothetical protein C6W56_09555 [Caldibacillus debilis]|nr:MAG: hypothetical protein C6W56_09555 [Caldibacillus debilis]